MFSKLHDRVGTAGLIVAIVALVVALSGTAIAASGALTGKQKKEVEKIAKKYAGKRGRKGPKGPAGATGPGGPAGPAGGAGQAGAKGDTGAAGNNGGPGANGKSVAVTEIPTEVEACEGRGGAEVAQEGAAGVEVCAGEEGSPWTAGGVLPSGKTETGTWSFATLENETALASISFPIPLTSAPEPVYVEGAEATCNALTEPEKGECLAEVTQKCPGVTSGNPQAKAGVLCLYVNPSLKPGNASAIFFIKPFADSPPVGAGPTGTVFEFGCASAKCSRLGTWAVTAG